MILPAHVHDNLVRSAMIVYPNGATTQGSREFIFTIVGSVSNAFRKCGLNIRLGIDTELRTLTNLTILTPNALRTIPVILLGGILTIGKDRLDLNTADSVASLVRAIFKTIEASAVK